MFERPEVGLIDTMHRIGRQLAVLKRLYQSYVLIIERILEKQLPLTHQSKHTAIESLASSTDNMLSKPIFGAPLSSAATVRFERLRDRIELYALSEIQECIDEKEALVFLVRRSLTTKEAMTR